MAKYKKSKEKEIEIIQEREYNDVYEVKDESWYSLYVVWGLAVIGILSLLFGNFYFKIIGLVTIIMCLSILTKIAKIKKQKGGE